VSGRPPSRARLALGRVLAVAHKELLQLARDRLSLGFIIGIPSLQLLLFGYAINMDVRHVRPRSSTTRERLSRQLAELAARPSSARRRRAEAIDLAASRSRGGRVPPISIGAIASRGADLGFADAAARQSRRVAAAGEELDRTIATRAPAGRAGAPAVLRRRSRIAVVPSYNPGRRTPVHRAGPG
jgi:ABC-2 type transport system permease protein